MIKYLILCVFFLLTKEQKEDFSNNEKEIPEIVLNSFSSLYPGIEKANWKKLKNRTFKVLFEHEGKKIELLFNNTGKVLKTVVSINKNELPGKILEKLSNDPLLLTAIKYIHENNVEYYRIIGKNDQLKKIMLFDGSGTLLSEKIIDKAEGKKNATIFPSTAKSVEKIWELPFILTEISGISFINNNQLACVQDELGMIFIYDLDQERVINKIYFRGEGDYEGIAIQDKTAWILESSGQLCEVENFLSENPILKVHALGFSQEQNLEGLCYDKNKDRLLIAPKFFDSSSTKFKGIYEFDLKKRKLNNKPVFQIDMEDEMLKNNIKKDQQDFMPSAIAVDPASGQIIIADAVNGLLLIANNYGKLKTLIPLDKKLFAKTEGIAFSSEGNLFTSNEGKKMKPNIIKMKF